MGASVARIRATVVGFIEHDGLTLAASIAFYTALSLAPLVLLALWAASALSWNAQDALLAEVEHLAGADVERTVASIIASADAHPTLGNAAGWFGLIVLSAGAVAVFAQLQLALNLIFGVTSPADASSTFWAIRWIRRRLLSVGILASATFVLIVSLMVSALLAHWLPAGERTAAIVVNEGVILLTFVALFTALFQYLPDVRLPWRDAIGGAVVTSLLFVVGKAAIARYITGTGAGTAYGPAGSFVVLLIWVYYSAAIFLVGAEWVQSGREDTAVAEGRNALLAPGELKTRIGNAR